MPGVGLRQALYPLWNELTTVASSLKSEEFDKEFEELLKKQIAKGKSILRQQDAHKGSGSGSAKQASKGKASGGNGKRSIVPITAEKYEGTAKRVCNTKVNPF